MDRKKRENTAVSTPFKVFSLLREKNLTIAFAESLTAGNLTARLVEYPGASQCLLGGITAYANSIKTNLLGVSPRTLTLHGAVSRETVIEMVNGLSRPFGADLQVAVSGIAGPDGGSPEKPVGTVHMAFLYNGTLVSEKKIFPGSREDVIKACVDTVYERLLKILSQAD